MQQISGVCVVFKNKGKSEPLQIRSMQIRCHEYQCIAVSAAQRALTSQVLQPVYTIGKKHFGNHNQISICNECAHFVCMYDIIAMTIWELGNFK